MFRRIPNTLVPRVLGALFLAIAALGVGFPGPLFPGALFPGTSVAADATDYVAGIDDLPLMAGLKSVPDAGVVFDKPAGRIVEAYAEGAVSRAEVASFYAATLPQLGWRARQSNVFQREGERLSLIFLGGDGDLVVRFTLEPE